MAAITSIAIPLVFILTLQVLNPLISFIQVNTKYHQLLLAMIGVPLAILISYIFNKSLHEILIPKKSTIKKTFLGLLLGIIITTLMIFTLLFFSELQVKLTTENNFLNALTWCFIFFPLAYLEEIIFRGQGFTKLKYILGFRVTQFIFAVLFAYYHDATGTTFTSQLLGPGIWALIFGWAAVKSNGIAFPTGIHAGINIIQAIFGLKEDVYTIWNFYYEDTVTQELQNKTEIIGLSMQLIVFITGIFLTEKIIKQKKLVFL